MNCDIEIMEYNMSPQQTRYTQLKGAKPEQLSYCVYNIKGHLEIAIIEKAIAALSENFSVLHTFAKESISKDYPDEIGQQYIFEYITLTKEHEEIPAILEKMQKNNKNLLQCVICRASHEFIMIISLPALIVDTYSFQLINQYISNFYEAQLKSLEFTREHMQYPEFSNWAAQLLERLPSQDYIQSFGGPKELPYIKGKERRNDARYRIESYRLSQKMIENLERVNHLTVPEADMEAILLSCWIVLISKLAGMEEVSVARLHNGRHLEELTEVIGLMSQYQTMADVTCTDKYINVLEQIHEITTIKNSMLSFYQEMKSATLVPNFGYCYFDLRSLQKNSDYTCSITECYHPLEYEILPLVFKVMRTNDSITLDIHYNEMFYDQLHMGFMLKQIINIMEKISNDIELKIQDIPAVSLSEQQYLIDTLNSNNDLKNNTDFLQQIEQTMMANMDCDAAKYDCETLKYKEVLKISTSISRKLTEVYNIKPNDTVGILLSRSIEWIPAIFGVLCAGGAFVPLDPELPKTRLKNMMETAGVTVVLTKTEYKKINPLDLPIVLLDLEPTSNVTSESSVINLTSVTEDSLAYIMFTSGSTGSPKAVGVKRKQLSNYLLGLMHRYPFEDKQTYAVVSSLTADLAYTSIFLSMLTGGCICIFSKDEATDPELFSNSMRKNQIDFLKIVPSHLRALLTSDAGENLLPKKTLMFGGEPLQNELIGQLQSLFPQCEIINHYGPTETTIGVLTNKIDKPADNFNGFVPVGRPLPNVQAYVLDNNFEIVPFGKAGELYIGGATVTEGYIGEQEITSQRFVNNPFIAHSKMYKTGDIVRYTNNGDIQFITRADRQQKINGYRIELSEIEAALAEHPSIEQVAVVVQEEEESKIISAFLVMDKDKNMDEENWREYLADQLPHYMIPNRFQILDRLPLTNNGKIDWNTLQAMKFYTRKATQEVRSPIEEIMIGIWKDTLGQQSMNIHEDFFSLGGHSLLATQMISRIRNALNVELSLKHLFETPTVAGMVQAVENVRMQKRDFSSVPEIKRQKATDTIPLSFGQERLWFLSKLRDANPAYNMKFKAEFTGSLNFKALEQAINEIIRRHEIVRTVYELNGDEPTQRVNEFSYTPIKEMDLSHLSAEAMQDTIQKITLIQTKELFDLSQGPLYKMLLFKLAEESHLLIVTMHHILSDAWGMGIIGNEIAALYNAFNENVPSPLHELPIQYSDYAIWQREWLKSSNFKYQEEYWLQQLKGVPTFLDLPTDHPRAAIETYKGGWIEFSLPAELSERIKEFSKQRGSTVYMVLMAAFEVLLYRYSNQSDFAIGMPIANRNKTIVEGLLGFFVNTLVLRATIAPEISFQELVQQVKNTTLEAYEYQDFPYEKLVLKLQPNRDLSHSPLFQVMFNFQNTPPRNYSLNHLRMVIDELGNETSKFDLLLSMTEIEGSFRGVFEYNSDLYDTDTIERMIHHYKTILSSAMLDSLKEIGQLQLIPEEEKLKLIEEWNDTEYYYDQNLLVHQRIDDIARRFPSETAVIYEDKQITYSELNKYANRVANYFKKMDVGSESIIGICGHRSIETVIAYLAVLKTGGAFLSLDPHLPQDRLQFMVDEAQPLMLITQKELTPLFEQVNVKKLYMDEFEDMFGSESEQTPESLCTQENAAYILYTSGSTGRPKGVVNTHQGMLNRLNWMQSEFPMCPKDGFILKASFSFDVSVWELFWPLMAGARLILAKKDRYQDPQYLAQLIINHSVTNIHFVPSMLQQFLEEPLLADCVSLQRVFCSGEAFPLEIKNRFFQKIPQVELHNMYGVTEAAMEVTHWKCTPDSKWGFIPAGRPIHNTQIYILDQYMHPVPAGVYGEIYIGGHNVARGYLERAELNKECFIQYPVGGEHIQSLYRTGDIARFKNDGTIDYQGRMDFQVKLRGYRIELGEIESLLRLHKSVENAVVIKGEMNGEECLIAYIVRSSDSHLLTAFEYRQYLMKKLPNYMLPAVFQFIDQFPLTSSGKIARNALPKSIKNESAMLQPAVLTNIENTIAGVWKELLGIEHVQKNDNFFDLGGHSLLIIKMHRQLEAIFEREIDFMSLFEYTTISGLASYLESYDKEQEEQKVLVDKDYGLETRHGNMQHQLAERKKINDLFNF